MKAPRTRREMAEQYEDLTAAMADKLGADEFMRELCKGFALLADPARKLITPESLARSSALLGMGRLSAEDAAALVEEGDIDGDGALDEREFCVLMVRLSPGIMRNAEAYLARAIESENGTDCIH